VRQYRPGHSYTRPECGSTDRPNHGWASRRRVPAYAPPCASLRVPAKRGRVEYANAMASSRPPAGSPEDVPNTRATDSTARQGGTFARCSFVVTVKLFRFFPDNLHVPFVSTNASTPRQFAPQPLSPPPAPELSKLGQRNPHGTPHGRRGNGIPTRLPSVRRAGTSF
jgi:hypothetical protein